MKAPIFGFRNLLDDGSLSGGSWVAGLPLTNMQDSRLAKVARSSTDSNADTQFLTTLSSARLVRAASLHKFNLSLAARIRLRAYADSTFTRSGTNATYHDKEGIVQTAGANEERRYHWINGVRTTLLEEARDNECLESEDLSATWADIGTPTLGTPNTASGVSLDLLGDNDAGAAEGKSQTVAFTGDAVKAVSVYWKAGGDPTPGGDELILRDTSAAADRLQATITETDGVPSVAMTTGTFLGGDDDPLADGVYRLRFQTAAVTAANTNSLRLYAGRLATVADTGDVYFGGIQAEDAEAPSSYIATTVAAATRNADTLFADFTAVPQEMTVLIEFPDIGNSLISVGGTDAEIFYVGDADGVTDPRFSCFYDISASTILVAHDNGTTTTAASVSISTLAVGDTVKVRAVLAANGGVTVGVTIGTADEVTSSDATGAELGAAWSDTRGYIGSRGSAIRSVSAIAKIVAQSGTKTLAEMEALEAGDLFTYQPYDSGWVNPYEVYPSGVLQPGHPAFGTTTLDAEDLADGYPVSWTDTLKDPDGVSTPIKARYWNFEFDDTANVDTYVEIGRAFLVYGYQPTHGIDIGARLGYDTSSRRTETDGGAAFHNARPRRRKFDFLLSHFDTDESLVYLTEMNRYLGTSLQFLFIMDPDDTVHMHRRAFPCTLERLSLLAFSRSQYNDQGFSLIEEL